MKLLRLEFFKCRRRKIVLVCAAVLAVEFLWMGVFLARESPEELRWGWMLLLYNLAMVDAIVLPLSVATLASRSCELEHKGGAFKLLETMASPGGLYAAKLGWGALVLAALLTVRSGPVSYTHLNKNIRLPCSAGAGCFGLWPKIDRPAPGTV